MPERLNKYLATNLGVSRREADDLIASGKVLIDDAKATIGDKVLANNTIKVDGKPVKPAELIYIALHKPPGYVSSHKRQDSTPTLYELLPPEYRNLKTVGRLDKDTSGLILLTNDGDFTYQMTHPKFAKFKEYEAEIDQPLAPLHQQIIADFGVELTDGTSKLGLTSLDNTRKKWQITMSEGRNRQIRRTFGALGYTITKLHRKTFGKYQLNTLPEGSWEKLDKA
ncbi:MAG: pseudouridine synthase [Candidatus Nomurabacteria bacterium]|jgi:23S rRNA pseudouridine2605 synthase|nr:pseudouridine synthase [Candidatus Nomurabacteria bacterium]